MELYLKALGYHYVPTQYVFWKDSIVLLRKSSFFFRLLLHMSLNTHSMPSTLGAQNTW